MCFFRHILIIFVFAFLTACTSTPFFVPNSPVTQKETTMLVTATIMPTINVSSTNSPKEDEFSNLHYATSIAEAKRSITEFAVSREQLLNGELIREAKNREGTFFSESVQPEDLLIVHLYGYEEMGVVFNSHNKIIIDPSLSPCKIVSVYTFPATTYPETYERKGVLVQAWKTTKGIRYLQYIFDIDKSIYEELDKQVIITPYYARSDSIKLIKDFSEKLDSDIPLEYLSIKYLSEIQIMMEQWSETSILPEELSFYPLQPIIMGEYVP